MMVYQKHRLTALLVRCVKITRIERNGMTVIEWWKTKQIFNTKIWAVHHHYVTTWTCLTAGDLRLHEQHFFLLDAVLECRTIKVKY